MLSEAQGFLSIEETLKECIDFSMNQAGLWSSAQTMKINCFSWKLPAAVVTERQSVSHGADKNDKLVKLQVTVIDTN